MAGVVLAGGLSTRMGQEKALLRVHGAQQPHLLERTYRLLRALAAPCWVSCRPGQTYVGYDCLHDAESGQGPCAGILTALLHANQRGCRALLALACDLPFMDTPTLRRLLAAHAKASPEIALTLYVAPNGRQEQLVAVYDVGALPFFTAALARGQRSLADIVPADRRQALAYTQEQALPFFNMNRPSDLAWAVAAAAQQN